MVTALEMTLYPVAELYAGALFFAIERASEVLRLARVGPTPCRTRSPAARTEAAALGREESPAPVPRIRLLPTQRTPVPGH